MQLPASQLRDQFAEAELLAKASAKLGAAQLATAVGFEQGFYIGIGHTLEYTRLFNVLPV